MRNLRGRCLCPCPCSASAVFLHVRPGNTAALALYRAVGFVPIAVVPKYYDTPGSGGLSEGPELQQVRQQQEQVAGPVAAGGDAVLLVLPLSEAATAATAVAGATVAAAVEAATEAAAREAAAVVAAGGVPPSLPAQDSRVPYAVLHIVMPCCQRLGY